MRGEEEDAVSDAAEAVSCARLSFSFSFFSFSFSFLCVAELAVLALLDTLLVLSLLSLRCAGVVCGVSEAFRLGGALLAGEETGESSSVFPTRELTFGSR